MPRADSLRLRTRAALALGIVAIVLPALGGAWATQRARSALEIRIQQGQLAAANALAAQSAQAIDSAILLARQTADRPGLLEAIRSGDDERIAQVLDSVIDARTYRALAVVSVGGEVVASRPRDLSALGTALTEAVGPAVTDPEQIEGDALTIVRQPIIAPDDTVVGTLIAEISFTRTILGVATLRFGESGSATIVRPDATVLLSGEPLRRGESLQAPALEALVRSNSSGTTTYFSGLVDREEIAAFVPATDHRWGVFVAQSTSEAFADADGLSRAILVGVIVLVALGLLVTLLMARNIATYAQRSREEGERLQRILAVSAEAAIGMDAAGTITMWNEEATRIFGWPASDAIGRSLADTIIPPGSRSEHEMGLRRFIETGEGPIIGRRLELNAVDRSGRVFPVELTVTAIPWRDSWIFHGLLHDISQRKAADQALRDAYARERQATARLREVDDLKNEFVGVVAHDLRSPLAVIAGYADLLSANAATLSPDERTQFLETISGGARSMAVLIDDVLNVARIESGQFSYEIVPYDLTELIEHTVREMLVADPSRRADTTGSDLPLVLGDPERYRQVLTNLLSNAFKYTPEDVPITVRAEARANEVVVSVRNEGEGIPAEYQDRLFQKFSRVPAEPGATKPKGTGLGLYICRSIVEAQGGKIWVASGPGQGTTFSFTIPISNDEEREEAQG